MGAGVVVYERRGAVTDRIQQGNQRAVVAILGGQGRVEPPPEVLQHVHEIPGRSGLGQAAREGAVEMGVGIDEAGSHHFARGVNALAAKRLNWFLGSDAGDIAVLDEDGVARQDGGRLAGRSARCRFR